MARTTTTAVDELLGVNYDGETSLTPYVAMATALIDRVVVCAATRGLTLTSDEAELLERNMAAHFYSSMDPLYSSKSTAGASGSFMWQGGQGLDGSRYGQAAKLLDRSGCLTALTTPGAGRARATWLGKRPSEQIPYNQRD